MTLSTYTLQEDNKENTINLTEFLNDTCKMPSPSIIRCTTEIEDTSPIHVSFEADQIVVDRDFPATISFCKGVSIVTVNQIKKIEKHRLGTNEYEYIILCGSSQKIKVAVSSV